MKRITSFIAAIAIALTAAAQNYGMVDISVCNMRETPNYSAEMVSQALLGTPVEILQYGGDYGWPEVKTPDGYTGWVHKDAIVPMTKEQLHEWNHGPLAVVTALTALVHEAPSVKSAVVSDVVGGDRLKLLGKCAKYLKVGFPGGRTGYISKADAKELEAWRKSLDNSAEGILKTALSMRGFPYIWAGMSPKGMDCSGFVRTVLFMHDIIIPRDSGPQSTKGELVEGKDALQPGDLVFFGRWSGDLPRVFHVGFYLGDGRFIHSLGLVKIGSFKTDDPLYDAYNTGRYLFGTRFLPYINKQDGISTTLLNELYQL